MRHLVLYMDLYYYMCKYPAWCFCLSKCVAVAVLRAGFRSDCGTRLIVMRSIKDEIELISRTERATTAQR